MKRVLISGASVAGPVTAWWLARNGMDVTLVERNDGVRDGGQTVDIRGASKTVVRRMGMTEAVVANASHEDAWAFVDANDKVVASFGADAYGGEGPVAELEILRGELAKLLIHECEGGVRFRYKDQIARAEDDGHRVRVSFASGEAEDFDVLVIAEGIGSRTRNAVFGDAVERRPLGLYTAYFTIPKGRGDGPVARWFNAPGGRCVFLRPDNTGTTRAVLNLLAKPDGLEKQSPDKQKRVLRDTFADAGWETSRVLDGMDASGDFYFEAIGQVKMPRWHKGRIAVVGDAAYCASPLSGMGTALGIVGGYVLAGELSRTDDHEQAFARYETIMRPYVEKAQNVPSFAPRMGQPVTRAGIAVQRLALKVGSNKRMGWLFARFLKTAADGIDLPDYGEGVRAEMAR